VRRPVAPRAGGRAGRRVLDYNTETTRGGELLEVAGVDIHRAHQPAEDIDVVLEGDVRTVNLDANAFGEVRRKASNLLTGLDVRGVWEGGSELEIDSLPSDGVVGHDTDVVLVIHLADITVASGDFSLLILHLVFVVVESPSVASGLKGVDVVGALVLEAVVEVRDGGEVGIEAVAVEEPLGADLVQLWGDEVVFEFREVLEMTAAIAGVGPFIAEGIKALLTEAADGTFHRLRRVTSQRSGHQASRRQVRPEWCRR